MTAQNPPPVIPRPSGSWPPWRRKRVVAPQGWRDEDIKWVPIGELVPILNARTTWAARSMSEAGPTYPALVLKRERTVHDGHRRYFTLLAGGWAEAVPVVHWRERRPGR